jgi:putative transcriptional regulator
MLDAESSKKHEFFPEDHLRRLGSGSVLLARDLNDPTFVRTIILLCQFEPDGSYGLILNRPAKMPLSEIFDLSDLDEMDRHSLQKIYVGGPVQPEEIQIVQISKESVDGALQVAPMLHVGGHFSDLHSILKADPSQLRLFLGYSGWSGGQLEKEVEMGAWEVFSGAALKVFQLPEDVLVREMNQVRHILSES